LLAKNRTLARYPTDLSNANSPIILFILKSATSPAEKHRMPIGGIQAFCNSLDAQHLKAHTVYLPDLGDEARNEQLHRLSAILSARLRVMKEPPKKGRPGEKVDQ
jgi:hypothetical protein